MSPFSSSLHLSNLLLVLLSLMFYWTFLIISLFIISRVSAKWCLRSDPYHLVLKIGSFHICHSEDKSRYSSITTSPLRITLTSHFRELTIVFSYPPNRSNALTVESTAISVALAKNSTAKCPAMTLTTLLNTPPNPLNLCSR